VAFNQAHWLFAFKYWVISWRIELIKKGMDPEKHNKSLKIVNIVVTLITVGLPAIDWVLYNNKKIKAFTGVILATNISLIISCFILIWGFKKLINVMKASK